jgi:hypothetical protein
VPKSCDKSNNPLRDQEVKSSCDGGSAFQCRDYAPAIANDTLSYGFAVMVGVDTCCKCYELTWRSGNARNKKMVVQSLNVAKAEGDVGKDDIIIMVPGGGYGPNEGGCKAQYGANW